MSKKGKFIPKNPDKYIGKRVPIYRSTWELTVMRLCDNHPNVVEWASEPFRIPYVNPITMKATVYVPDFLMVYVDDKKRKFVEVVEVKPIKESLMEKAKSKKDKIALVINSAKWAAAHAWCAKRGMKFRVITEESIYRNHKK